MTELHSYQEDFVQWAMERLYAQDKQGCFLMADMGCGKTLSVMELIYRLQGFGECNRVLILGPLNVIKNVWEQESKKHGYDFTFDVCHGENKLRALHGSADIALMNYEGLHWLGRLRPSDLNGLQFDMVVFDESTRVKNWSAKSVRILRRMRSRLGKCVNLSGTPAPRSLLDLHSQFFFIDPEILGQTVGWFRVHFAQVEKQTGLPITIWRFRNDKVDTLYDTIAPATFRVSAHDYLDMPGIVYNDIIVDLPRAIMRQYRTLERELFLELSSGQTLVSSGAGAKYAATKALANGGAYETLPDGTRVSHTVHNEKALAVESVIEEAAGKPVIVAYNTYRDRDHLLSRKMFKGKERVVKYVDGTVTSQKERTGIFKAWNNNELDILMCNPASVSHGLNLQEGRGGDIVYMGPVDSLENFDQLNARLYRQGFKGGDQVRIHQVLCRGTVDIPISRRLLDKDRNQRSLLDTLNEYRRSQE